jgi:feruloyl esterase
VYKVLCAAVIVVCTSCTAVAQSPAQEPPANSCERISQLSLPDIKISSAQLVSPGAFTPPAGMLPAPAATTTLYKALPEFCRVEMTATPSADSSIKIEVWMPASGWNGKFQGEGNGGFAGEISYANLAAALRQGYAVASTDTGHSASAIDAHWALGHPEKIIDYGYRGIHIMTLAAKAVIPRFYGSPQQRSYFLGCSNGGRQALMEAQRLPDDYDGIIAGAPANYWTHLLTNAISNIQTLTLDPASYIPPTKLAAIAHAVNEQCDAKDGVRDGILNDPSACHFDPRVLLCKNGDAESCLTGPQVKALQILYQGGRDSGGRMIFPGYLPGAEEGGNGWGIWIAGAAPGGSLMFAFGNGYFSNMVYGDAAWNYKNANIDDAMKAADEKTAAVLNATDANLAAFKSRGGKLIVYHGWNDPAISALNSIDYFTSVAHTLGEQQADSFVRLYLVPGMQHCSAGPGADAFGASFDSVPQDPQHNIQLAIEQWVEKGVAPAAIIATKYEGEGAAAKVKMTRPLCPYPQAAKYKGAGNPNDAANFTCAVERVIK